MLSNPLNDKECLALLHAEVERVRALPELQELAAQFYDLNALETWFRSLASRATGRSES